MFPRNVGSLPTEYKELDLKDMTLHNQSVTASNST
jgi:hypothetical protein